MSGDLFVPHSTGVNDSVWVVDHEEPHQQDIIIISHVLDLLANLTTHYTPTKWKSVLLENKALEKKPTKQQAICSGAVSKVGFGRQSKHIICLPLTNQLKTKLQITEELKMHPQKSTTKKKYQI